MICTAHSRCSDTISAPHLRLLLNQVAETVKRLRKKPCLVRPSVARRRHSGPTSTHEMISNTSWRNDGYTPCFRLRGACAWPGSTRRQPIRRVGPPGPTPAPRSRCHEWRATGHRVRAAATRYTALCQSQPRHQDHRPLIRNDPSHSQASLS